MDTYSPFVIDFYTSQSEGAGNYYEERTSVSFRPVWNLNVPLIDIENSYVFEVDDLGNLQSITDADGNILCACYYEEGAVNIVPNETYEAPATEPTGESYIDCYKEILKEEESSGADASYIIYDINKDGIPEMIIRENSYYFYVYTFSDYAAVLCGEFIGYYPNGLYAYDGNGLVVNTGGSGTMRLEDILLYSLENGSLFQGEAIAYESSPEYVAECLAAYTNISYFTSVSDYSLLENN